MSSSESGAVNGRILEYDPHFTESVIAATGPKAHPRLAQIMPGLLRHLHDFAREEQITVAEWTAAVDMINESGRMSDDRRNETQLLCDVIGLESLVDEITSLLLKAGHGDTTPSAILGPFYRTGAPELPNGSCIVKDLSPSVPWYEQAVRDTTFLHGRVYSSSNGGVDKVPLAGAKIDVWHTAPNGLYEQQDPSQPDMNLRGRFTSDSEGRFSFYCLRPVPYPIPDDGPAGRLLHLLDRHPMRPAHIHFVVECEGHRSLTTQVFDADGKYVKDDSVFAVKGDLLRHFRPRKGDSKANWDVESDFILSPKA